jgi:hypothetical protein
MSKKDKKQQMPLDVAKAVWEEYSNIIKENWTRELAMAVASKEWDAVREIGKNMSAFKFKFNRDS